LQKNKKNVLVVVVVLGVAAHEEMEPIELRLRSSAGGED
jgi:hypothetical protein